MYDFFFLLYRTFSFFVQICFVCCSGFTEFTELFRVDVYKKCSKISFFSGKKKFFSFLECVVDLIDFCFSFVFFFDNKI